MSALIFGVGLAIFVTYMYFLVKMINTQHKIQERELKRSLKKTVRGNKIKVKKSKHIKVK